MLVDLDYQNFEVPEKEGVSVDVRVLDTWAYQKLLSLIGKFKLDDATDESQAVEKFGNAEIATVAKDVIPGHCRNLKGIEVKKGGDVRPMSIDELCDVGQTLDICFLVLVQLFTISNISSSEAKTIKK